MRLKHAAIASAGLFSACAEERTAKNFPYEARAVEKIADAVSVCSETRFAPDRECTLSRRKGFYLMLSIEELRSNAVSRRAFLTRMTAAGLGSAAVALLAGCGGDSNGGVSSATRAAFTAGSVVVPGGTDNEVVLNYALTLETLEADLYRQALNAASGRALTAALDSTAPAAGSTGSYTQTIGNGGLTTQFASAAFLYLVQFAYVEAAHRDFLRTVLGGAANPITPASGRYKFATTDGTPGTDLSTILSNIVPLEETGVSAYLGAAGYLTDNNTVETAVSIYSTEARHSAALAYLLGRDPGPRTGIAGVPAQSEVATGVAANVFEKYITPSAVLTAASGAYFA